MKSTGIVRKVDELGRVVIPKELRKVFNISEKDPLEIYTDQDSIILRKYESACGCVFCGNAKNIMQYKGKNVCSDCVAALEVNRK